MMPKSVYIQTYGCTANQNDSEIMAGLLVRGGCNIVKNEEEADVIVVNTCTVKDPTEQKELFRIQQLNEKYPNKKLVLAGCLVQSQPNKVKKIAPRSSLIGVNAVGKISDMVFTNEQLIQLGKAEDKVILPKVRNNPIVDIIQISEGCSSRCTFCATKNARGDLQSYNPDRIVSNVKNAIEDGCKEILLTSQDCSVYGLDRKKNVAQLLKKISTEVSGDYKIRLGMANPAYMKKILPELIEAYKSEKVFKFLHLPIQSGSNKILWQMRRGNTKEEFLSIINDFRKHFPQIQIWTDIIVGYPKETEEDFQQTLSLIEQVKPDFVNISRFGARPNTEAAKLKQLSTEVVKERSRKLTELCKKIYEEKNKEWLGWCGPVVIDEFNEEKKTWSGRNFAYKQIILKENKQFKLGQITKVKVSRTDQNMYGEIIQGQ